MSLWVPARVGVASASTFSKPVGRSSGCCRSKGQHVRCRVTVTFQAMSPKYGTFQEVLHRTPSHLDPQVLVIGFVATPVHGQKSPCLSGSPTSSPWDLYQSATNGCRGYVITPTAPLWTPTLDMTPERIRQTQRQALFHKRTPRSQ